MRRRSLRLRLVAGGAVAIVLALAAAWVGLSVLFERHAARTIAADLDVHLKQLIAAIDVDAQGRLVVTRAPSDPRFADPLSGLYWQIGNDGDQLLRSRSLWDTTLSLPADDLQAGEIHHHVLAGPAGANVMVAERRVTLTVADRSTPVRIVVAVDLARVSAARADFARDLLPGLALLALVLALATWIQVGLGLRPLDRLRRGIAGIRAGVARHLPANVPSEVGPLVDEVNALLDAREREIERSWGRAADLAHGLKTPLAALAADAERLRAKGEAAIAADIAMVGDAMRRHVDRELTRARIRGVGASRAVSVTPLAPLVASLVATLARTPDGERIAFDAAVAEHVVVPIDRTDLAEVLGNLLENAARHARTRVRIAVSGPAVVVADDGPGIAPEARTSVLARGVRLDQRAGGAGLGLAIVQDVLDAYGWSLDLGPSDLGGLKATIAPAAAPAS